MSIVEDMLSAETRCSNLGRRSHSGIKHARHDIERDQALLAGGVAVNGEGDADAAEEEFDLFLAFAQDVGRRGVEQVDVVATAASI